MGVLSVVRRFRWLLVSVVVVVVGGVVAAVVWWPRPAREAGPVVYRDFDVCLLTGADGVGDPQAAAVWAGAQRVAGQRRVRALWVPVVGEQSAERAGQFLASLVAQDCEVIVAVGDAPVAAAATNRALYPGVTIVIVGMEIDGSSVDATTTSTVSVLSGLVPAQS